MFAPGERFQYSNIAYEILGDVVAKVSGASFENDVHRNILQPLGMRDSTLLGMTVSAPLPSSRAKRGIPDSKLPKRCGTVEPIVPTTERTRRARISIPTSST